MRLAQLAFDIARDSIEIEGGFNLYSFIRGDYDDDRDYSSQISFAFSYINLAFARLFTGKKTLLKVKGFTPDEKGYVEVKDGEVTAAIEEKRPDYKSIDFIPFADGIAVEGKYANKEIFIEYRPFIPRFDLSSIREQSLDENGHETYVEKEIDLSDYGITDEMCAYVKEYAKGGLLEYLSPDMSQRHTQMAEAYFASLKTHHTNYPQREIKDRFGFGGAL